MISKELNSVFNTAYLLAKVNKSEFLTTEHIFLSICMLDKGKRILTNLGADADLIREKLEKYLDKYLVKHNLTDKEEKDFLPEQTFALGRIFTDMLTHVESSGKKEAAIGDFLASVYVDRNSYSLKLLNYFDIERLDILEYITENDNPESKEESENNSQKEKKQSLLELYTRNLTKEAKNGSLDPLIGRSKELKDIIRTLCRRKKNNPLIIGEAGVGKTALVEGLAQKITNKEVPEKLLDSEIFGLDMGSLVAGTKYRGEFEKRIKGVLAELEKQSNPILFLDEVHSVVGAGSASGSLDASNILKPVLETGRLRCIGTTTYSEVKRIFDKENGFSRRFEKINIEEPDFKLTRNILEGLKSRYEDFHHVEYDDSALEAAVELAKKYMVNKFLPDTAIDLMDEAGANIIFSDSREIQNADTDLAGDNDYEIPKRIITREDLENLIAGKLNLSLKPDKKNEIEDLRLVDSNLKKVIFGQDKPIEDLCRSIKRNKAGLSDEDKPIGSFLFSGPTGVGKTALAKELADLLNISFIRFDMSEYMEKHTVSRLIGAPAGYVGYDEGGLLTEAVRKTPHAVLLLDEVEKAHQDVLNILLQIMDEASLTDSSGVKVDFKNIILIMTSNLGSRESRQIGFKADQKFTSKGAVKKFFSPEFRNRLDAELYFNSLSINEIKLIVDKFLGELQKRVNHKNVFINASDKAKDYLAKEGFDPILGARPLKRLIQQEVADKISDEILFGKLRNGGEVKVGYCKEITIKIE